MADSPSNRSPETSASQSTRQLLDDLDALMQRMLAVPVKALDEEGQPPVVSEPPPDEMPAPTPERVAVPSPALIVQAPLPGSTQEVVVGRAPEIRPPAPEPPPLLHRREQTPAPPVAAPTYLPLGAEPLLPMILQRPQARTERAPATGAAPVASPPAGSKPPAPRPTWLKSPPAPRSARSAPGPSWYMRLLVYINRTFDRYTEWLGSPGRWLRSEQGRAILGWTGVGMLGIALAWAALRFLV